MELVENAYPEVAYSSKVELARDQFIQGVAISNDMREGVFMNQPEAVRIVRQMESALKACRAAPALEKKKTVVGATAGDEKISAEIHELMELVLGMNDDIRELERKTETKSAAAPRRRDQLVCYTSRRPGHYGRELPS